MNPLFRLFRRRREAVPDKQPDAAEPDEAFAVQTEPKPCDLTTAEISLLEATICPDCEEGRALLGPRVGMLTRIYCHDCGQEFHAVLDGPVRWGRRV